MICNINFRVNINVNYLLDIIFIFGEHWSSGVVRIFDSCAPKNLRRFMYDLHIFICDFTLDTWGLALPLIRHSIEAKVHQLIN